MSPAAPSCKKHRGGGAAGQMDYTQEVPIIPLQFNQLKHRFLDQALSSSRILAAARQIRLTQDGSFDGS